MKFTYDGFTYTLKDECLYNNMGEYMGAVFKSACGEYWIYDDGETCGGCVHENHDDALTNACIQLIIYSE